MPTIDEMDPADAARYGLVSGVRYAGIGAPGTGQSRPGLQETGLCRECR